MDAPGSDEIAAMLTREGVNYDALPRVAHEGNPRDLLAGRADAMVAYSTSEPFVLDQLGASYRIFSPEASGIDFYGDNLCTSDTEVEAPVRPPTRIWCPTPSRRCPRSAGRRRVRSAAPVSRPWPDRPGYHPVLLCTGG